MQTYLLNNHYKKKAEILFLLGLLCGLTGLVLTWAGFEWSHNVDIEMPFYSPFIDIAKYIVIVALLVWVFSKEKNEDEFILQIRLKSFYISILTTSLIVVLNEALYFFTDKFAIEAIAVILFQLILNAFILHVQLKIYKAEE